MNKVLKIWLVGTLVNILLMWYLINFDFFEQKMILPIRWICINFIPISLILGYAMISNISLDSKAIRNWVIVFLLLCIASIYTRNYLETYEEFIETITYAPFFLLPIQIIIIVLSIRLIKSNMSIKGEIREQKTTSVIQPFKLSGGDAKTTATQIYFSYAWRDEDNPDRENLVNELYKSLRAKGYAIQRDKENCGYGEYIDEFMEAIGNGKLIIVFLSEKYFRSEYCMTELLLIADEVDWDKAAFKERILPIQVEPIDYDDDKKRLALNEYWKAKKEENQKLNEQLEKSGMRIDQEEYKQSDRMVKVANRFSTLKTWIRNLNRGTTQLYKKDDFKLIETKIKERLAVIPILNDSSDMSESFITAFMELHQQLIEKEKNKD